MRKKINIIKNLLFSRNYRIRFLAERGFFNKLDDEKYLKLIFKATMGKDLNLESPKTYNEKLQWLKIHDHNPLYTTMVDKFLVKDYVADRIGTEYLIPTLGVWNSFDEIDFSKLPDKFVLKCTHDSGGVFVCKDKSHIDIDMLREFFGKSMSRNYYWQGREWPYKNVKPRIIAEQYMEDTSTKELRDYKFFCFDGKVKALFVASERQSESEETKFDFFDENYHHLPVTNGHPNALALPEKPNCFDLMKKLAEVLSENIPHLRVDFYEANGKVYFGELTFYHWSGMVPFDPPEWDKMFGSWISLPDISGK